MMKRRSSFAILLATLVMVSQPAAHSDELKLKDGTKIVGTIVGFEENSFKVKTSYGFAVVQKDQVLSISITDSAKKPDPEKKPVSSPEKPEPTAPPINSYKKGSTAPPTPPPAVPTSDSDNSDPKAPSSTASSPASAATASAKTVTPIAPVNSAPAKIPPPAACASPPPRRTCRACPSRINARACKW